jgi:hypothetical protein
MDPNNHEPKIERDRVAGQPQRFALIEMPNDQNLSISPRAAAGLRHSRAPMISSSC